MVQIFQEGKKEIREIYGDEVTDKIQKIVDEICNNKQTNLETK